MKFIAAIRFLTTIPLPWWRECTPEELGRSTGFFPVIGIIIGLILIGLNWLFGLFLPSAIVSILLVIASVIISGAMHLDGLADTCDGIAGQKSPEERWRVMSDSRTGGFGIVGVCCLLLAKYVALNSVPSNLIMVTLLLMPMISRWTMVYAIFAYPYAKPSGMGKFVKQEARWHMFVWTTVITLAVAIVLAQLKGLVLILVTWIIVLAIAAYLKRKFSGLTGDTYGAINEIAEVCVLILISILAHLGLA